MQGRALGRSELTQISRNACPSPKNTGNFYRQIFLAPADMSSLPSFIEFRDHLGGFKSSDYVIRHTASTAVFPATRQGCPRLTSLYHLFPIDLKTE